MAARKHRKNTSGRVTAEDLARKLGVSAMTVSRALNGRPNVEERTRQKVIEGAHKYGYTPDHIARSLTLRRTKTIGVLIPEISYSFFPEVIRGIDDAVYAAGYHLIFAHSAEDENRELDAITTLKSKRVDGLLISKAQTVTDNSAYSEAIRLGIPIVFFDRVVEGLGATCVSIDDEDCCSLVTEHLVGHGYKAIAHLSGPLNVSIGRGRRRGYQKALRHNNIKYRTELVVQSGLRESGGYRAMEMLLELPPRQRPDAVVAVNDPSAFGAMKAIKDHGLRIPQDIAIVGIADDLRSEIMFSPLTTIRQPAYKIGETAAAALISEIEGKEKSGRKIIVDTEIVLRKSCGCL